MASNFCSNCGHRVYQHTHDGCTYTDLNEDVHTVRVGEPGDHNLTAFTLKHPARERADNDLFDCQIHRDLRTVTGWPKPGDYRIVENANGGWSFEQPAEVRVPCDCTRPHSFLTDMAWS